MKYLTLMMCMLTMDLLTKYIITTERTMLKQYLSLGHHRILSSRGVLRTVGFRISQSNTRIIQTYPFVTQLSQFSNLHHHRPSQPAAVDPTEQIDPSTWLAEQEEKLQNLLIKKAEEENNKHYTYYRKNRKRSTRPYVPKGERVTYEFYLDVLRFFQVKDGIIVQGVDARRAEYWMSRLEEHEQNGPSIDRVAALLEGYWRTIRKWANSDGEDPIMAVKRAEKWVDKVKSLCQKVRNDNEFSPMKVQHLSTNCCNEYLNLLSKGRGKNEIVMKHAQQAEDILMYMIDQYENYGEQDSFYIPDIDSFNYVLRAITRCRSDPDVANRAKKLLKFMELSCTEEPISNNVKVEPNAKSYNMVLDSMSAVAKWKVRNCLRTKAVEDPANNGIQEMIELHNFLHYMEQLVEAGADEIIDSNVPYNTVMSAWAHVSGTQKHFATAPMEAEKIFQKLVEFSTKHGRNELSPDTTSYLQVREKQFHFLMTRLLRRMCWAYSFITFSS